MKRSTLILLLLAVALGGAAYYVIQQDKKLGTSRDSEETSKPAFKFKSEEIASLSITRAGQTTQLENQSGKWQITAPINAEADGASIDSIISDLTNATVERTLVMTASLERGSGLGNPAVTVDVKLKNGEQHKVALGRQDPTGSAVYALIDQGKDVALLSPSLLTSANKSLSDLRSKTIIKANADELARIEIKNQNLTLITEQNSESKWLIKEPADKKDKEAKTEKIFAFQNALATEVIDAPTPEINAKLASPAVEVRLTDKSGKITVLQISAADGDNIYARVEGQSVVYKANKRLLEDLNFKLADVAP
ncbi:MAG TPA: DUF4340 domain-containing protein [Blastocatellia bacterium]|nr:DUF4340 domain-containing protein [Blastocatellia bacterium]